MYRLVLYYLICIVVFAIAISFYGYVSYTAFEIATSTLLIVIVCVVVNYLFAKAFRAPQNFESAYITALILALLIGPTLDKSNLMFMIWAAVLAIASKFVLAIRSKHIFNPAAIAVVITAYTINQSAVWWVGNAWMLPLVFVGGFLIMRKIQREDLVFSFVATAIAVSIFFGITRGSDLLLLLKEELVYSPLFFFAFVMLTEPMTTPPTKKLQIWYGVLVGVLFAPQIHFGNFYFTPELALVVGNIFSYIVSPKGKYLLKLKQKQRLSADTYDFVFELTKPINYRPGQYMEWTLGHWADARGNRRYFTLASSPTENELRLGVKFYQPSSTFKQHMLNMHPGSTIVAGQLAGDFTFSEEPNEKSVFIAGGIGITPFRSMIKYLIDNNQKRDIVLIFSNANASDIVYKEVFDQALQVGVKTVYTITENIPQDWSGERGRIDEAMVSKHVPDIKDRIVYISGTHSMVTSMEDLFSRKLKAKKIKTDFFPGYV